MYSEISDAECRYLSDAYHSEIEEMRLGIHPTQVSERIKERLKSDNINFNKITFLNWNVTGPKVRVSLDNKEYGIFNYETNVFELVL